MGAVVYYNAIRTLYACSQVNLSESWVRPHMRTVCMCGGKGYRCVISKGLVFRCGDALLRYSSLEQNARWPVTLAFESVLRGRRLAFEP